MLRTGDAWVREKEQDEGVKRVVSAFSADGNRVLKITLESCFPDGDASMVVAAPALLDALENLVIGIGMGWDLDGMIEQAQAAIAKAEGR